MVSEKETVAETIEELPEAEQGVNEAGDEHTTLMKEPKKKTLVLTMVLSFVIPMIIMALAFYNNQIYPGGKNTVLIYDMRAQFISTFASLKYLGKSDSSLFFSLYGALGNNEFPNYASYIFDPFSWITVLFSLERLPDVLFFITLIKIGLCGLGFCTFLIHKRSDSYLLIIILSCCYALMSYNVIYSECLLWLNVVALTPLVLMGVDYIIDEKRGWLYILTILLCMCYVFQMAFMTGILVIMYFFYRLSENRRREFRGLYKIIGYSILALGIYAPICIPTLISAFGARLKSGNAEDKLMFYYPVWNVLKQLASCSYDTLDTGGLPFVFCGSITIILVLGYFVLGKKTVVNKLISLLVILFFLVSFCVGPLNRMWHGFVEPHSFPCRYSYLFCCFLLILAHDTGEAFFAYIGKIPASAKGLVYVFVTLFVLGEQYMNASYVISCLHLEKSYTLSIEYDYFLQNMQDVLSHINDKDLYRIGRGDSWFTPNDSVLLNYNGIGHFGSFYEKKTMDFMGLMGYSENDNVLEDRGETPLIDSILGVKYAVLSTEAYDMGYESIFKKTPYHLLRNNHALPIGFVMGDSDNLAKGLYKFTTNDDDGNAFAYHELLLSDIYGSECGVYDYLNYDMKEIEDESGRHVQIELIAKDDKPIWLFCKEATKEQFDRKELDNNEGYNSEVIVNGEKVSRLRTRYSSICTYIGSFRPGEKVLIDAKDSYYFGDPWIVSYDEEKCNEILDEINNKQGINVTYHRNGQVIAEVVAPYDETCVLFSFPAMSGYNIRIDGRETDYGDYRGALLMVRIPRGKHFVEIAFVPPGFKLGIIIGTASIFFAVVLMLFLNRRKVDHETNLIQK